MGSIFIGAVSELIINLFSLSKKEKLIKVALLSIAFEIKLSTKIANSKTSISFPNSPGLISSIIHFYAG